MVFPLASCLVIDLEDDRVDLSLNRGLTLQVLEVRDFDVPFGQIFDVGLEGFRRSLCFIWECVSVFGKFWIIPFLLQNFWEDVDGVWELYFG